MTTVEAVRARAMHYLSDEVAASAGMTLAQMQQLIAGTYHPSDKQLELLVRRMGLEEPR